MSNRAVAAAGYSGDAAEAAFLMLLAGLFKRPITVTFKEEGTGRVIATWRVPLDKLPEAFRPDHRLNMGGEHYVVVGATPPTRAKAAETRRLAVVIRRVATSHS